MTASETRTETQYLYLVGELHPDNRLELLSPFLTTDPRDVGEALESPLSARLYDADEKLLLRYRISVGSYCAPGTTIRALAVRGKLPFHPATRLIRFSREDVVVHEIQVGDRDPEVRLTWETSGTVKGKHTITWEASHPEGVPLQFFLRYSHDEGASWQPASFPTKGNQKEIDFDQFPGGKACRMMVVATDGVRTSTAESRPFGVPIKPCRTMILAPQDGSEFLVGQTIVFQGQGYYIEERRPELEGLHWTSSRDGELGRGTMIESKTLSPGLHQIQLRGGTGERAGEASISIAIGGEPPQRWVLSSRDSAGTVAEP